MASNKNLNERRILVLGNDTASHRHNGYVWRHNRYYADQTPALCADTSYKPFDDAMPDDGFGHKEAKPYAQWQSETGLDLVGSSYSCGSLPGNYAVVRANKYEKRRAHIVVYNWKYLTKGTTKVGISLSSAGLTPGDKVTIDDVQSFNIDPAVVAPTHFGKVVSSGTYSPGVVAVLDLGKLTKGTAPIGLRRQCPGDASAITQLPHTAPLFGAFLLIAKPAGIPANPSPKEWKTNPTEHAFVKTSPSVVSCPNPNEPCTADANAISESIF